MTCINYDFSSEAACELPIIATQSFDDPTMKWSGYGVTVNLCAGPNNTWVVDLYDSDMGGPNESTSVTQYDNEAEARADYDARVTEISRHQHQYMARVFGAATCCFETEIAGDVIMLMQYGIDDFTVIYGQQHRTELSYADAAKELGLAIMHARTRDCMLDTVDDDVDDSVRYVRLGDLLDHE